jgi:hypothetical protein
VSALGRLRPTRSALAAVIGFLWAISFGALRDFVWADLRAGLITLQGLRRPTRVLVWIGFLLVALMLAALLFNDFWRATSPLLPLTQPLPGRGQMLPLALLPATLFLLTVAWAYLLAGALHSHWLVRVGVLAVFLPAAGLWLSNGLASVAISGLTVEVVLGAAAAILTPIFFVLRARQPARPAAEFLVVLLLAALVFTTSQTDDITGWRQLGSPLMAAKIEAMLGFLEALILPLLILVGLDMASFARQASLWTMQVVTRRFPYWLELVALGALLGLRLRHVVLELAEKAAENGLQATLAPYGGAAGVLVLVAAAWLLVARLKSPPAPMSTPAEAVQGAERLALPAIIAVNAPQIVAFAGLWLSLGLLPLMQFVTLLSGAVDNFAKAATDPWSLAVGPLAVIFAVFLARREGGVSSRTGGALFAATFGLLHLWFELTDPGRPLGALFWRGPEPLDFWLVVAICVVALIWTVRRQFTGPRIAALLFAGMITGLLRQIDFISSPFSLLGFGGLGFLVFGIGWDVLTAGSWANTETAGLPRPSRILLYLGYVLLTVTAVNWAVTAHDLASAGRLTGEVANLGLDRIGRPMLYAVMLAAMLNPVSLGEEET